MIYPFIVNNPGEAVQAKRRLAAVTIGHLTPPLSAAGLAWRRWPSSKAWSRNMPRPTASIAAACAISARRSSSAPGRSGLAADCGLVRGEANRDAIAKLDAQLCDIKDLSIRDSLHVFGRAPDPTFEACAVGERAGLLAALDGRRVAPGPAGAPSRGRPDVLPTGRNLTSIDPRAIPTRTAAAIGARAADEVVRRYLQDHGDIRARW